MKKTESTGGEVRLERPVRRDARKKAKLQARGTYRRSDQYVLDRCRKRVIESAERLAKHLGITGEQLLVEIGFDASA